MTVLRRRGATTIEYALLLMLICLGCIIAVSVLGGNVRGLFSGVIPVAAADDDDPPTAAVTDAADDDGKTTPSVGGKGKKAKKQHHRGQPGNGNAGNDKAVGNAPAKSQ